MTLMLGGFLWIKKPETAALQTIVANIPFDAEKRLKSETSSLLPAQDLVLVVLSSPTVSLVFLTAENLDQ